MTDSIPSAVASALKHVRRHHPAVVMVVFKSDGRWLYMDEDGWTPRFGENIDVGILEDAADSLVKLPAVYEWPGAIV
jgi:hypothetical protein